jgi:hypothetical protein
MGIFDKLKSSLGMKKTSSASSGARRLGGGESALGDGTRQASRSAAANSFENSEFTLTFAEIELGFEVDSFDHKVIISQLTAGGAAESKGVKVGDVVLSVEGNEVSSPEVLTGILGALDRPIGIRFKRLFKMTDAEIATIVNAQPRVATVTHVESTAAKRSVFDKISGKPAPRIETVAEKESRRAMMAQAAAQRESKNPWEKQARSSKKSSLDSDDAGPDTSAYSAETLRSVQQVKDREVQMVRELGYNPFAPVMASSANKGSAAAVSGGAPSPGAPGSSHASPHVSGASSSSSSSSSSSADAGRKEAWTSVHQELVEGLCDEALALLLSMSEGGSGGEVSSAGQDAVTTCIATTVKMLENIKSNPREPKFRSVRVQNANFNSKVYSVPGGAQLFTAAGFQLYTEGGDSILDQEAYLRHDMTYMKTKMLVYVLDRLKELQQ